MSSPQVHSQPPPLNGGDNLGHQTPLPLPAQPPTRNERFYINLISMLSSYDDDRSVVKFISNILSCLCLGGAMTMLAYIICLNSFNTEPPEFDISKASLTDFRLSAGGDTLYYNLSIDMKFDNHNYNGMKFLYGGLIFGATYQEHWFASREIPGFRLEPFKTHYVNVVFEGEYWELMIGKNGLEIYESERKESVFNIVLLVYHRIQYLRGKKIKREYYERMTCDLKVPLKNVNWKNVRVQCMN